jgi:hypothetical protein
MSVLYDIETIFVILWEAVAVLEEIDKVIVFQAMAWNLIDKLDAPRPPIRDVLKRYEMCLDENCEVCGTDISGLEPIGKLRCKQCADGDDLVETMSNMQMDC